MSRYSFAVIFLHTCEPIRHVCLSIIYRKTFGLEILQLQLTHNHEVDSNIRFVYPEGWQLPEEGMYVN